MSVNVSTLLCTDPQRPQVASHHTPVLQQCHELLFHPTKRKVIMLKFLIYHIYRNVMILPPPVNLPV